MKRIGLSALVGLMLLTGCGDGGEKKAQAHLQKAEEALKQENFSEAKLQIDSIKILYPKAFEARKQGIKLMQQVDLNEQRKTLVYLDSMMQIKQLQLDSIKGNFVLEKDSVAEQLALINEQLIIKNRRARRIWKVILVIFIAINLFIGGLLLLFMVDPENSTEEISESVECIEE